MSRFFTDTAARHRHRTHAEIIVELLHSRYPRWTSSSDLVAATKSRNLHARLQRVRKLYGVSLEVEYDDEEALYRLNPAAPLIDPVSHVPRRIFVKTTGLDAEAIGKIRAYADSLRTTK